MEIYIYLVIKVRCCLEGEMIGCVRIDVMIGDCVVEEMIVEMIGM